MMEQQGPSTPIRWSYSQIRKRISASSSGTVHMGSGKSAASGNSDSRHSGGSALFPPALLLPLVQAVSASLAPEVEPTRPVLVAYLVHAEADEEATKAEYPGGHAVVVPRAVKLPCLPDIRGVAAHGQAQVAVWAVRRGSPAACAWPGAPPPRIRPVVAQAPVAGGRNSRTRPRSQPGPAVMRSLAAQARRPRNPRAA